MEKTLPIKPVLLASMLLCTVITNASAEVVITTGPTPIPGGDANSPKDITIKNEKLAVSFSVETPAPWGVAKGGIIDAGIVRDGKIEMDRVTLVDFIPNNWSSWPTTYQQVEVVEDTGERAVIKTTRDWEKTQLETIYTLLSGDNKIHIVTTISNTGESAYTDLLSGYVLWTDGGHLFTTPGLGDTKKGTTEKALADWVVNYDEDWAVGLHAPYFNYINYYARDMYLQHTLNPGETRTFEGWLQIDSNGDVSSMLASEIERKGLAAGTVSGTVSTEDGKRVADSVVVAEKDGQPYAWALSKDGSYSFTLPEGAYSLYAAGKSYANSSKGEVQVKGGTTLSQDFNDLKYPGKISFTVADEESQQPLDARITIEEGHSPVVGFLGKKTFFTELEPVGQVEVPIAPGSYTFKVASAESFLSKASMVTVDVTSKKSENLSVALKTFRSPKQSGWYCSDMHHHSNLLDGVTSPEYVVRSQLAAGLDFTLLSDHDLVTNNPVVQELSDKRGVMFIPSIEISPSWAHFNAFPVTPGKVLDVDPGTASVDEVFAAARRMGAMALSANHPYISYGYFHSLDNGTVPGGFNAQFDLIELNAATKYEKTIKRMWKLWSEGTKYYLSAGTDAHDVWKDLSGKIRMFGYIEGDVTKEKFITSLKEGRAFASFGPLVEPEIMFGSEMKVGKGQAATLNYTVRAVEGLKEVKLISNGETVETLTFAEGETEKAISFKVSPAEDTWYALALADSKDNMAWTNPIWVDVVSYTKTPDDL